MRTLGEIWGERIVGITFLPSLSQQQKERMLKLPKIRQKKQRSS